jgi:hypothetical protein
LASKNEVKSKEQKIDVLFFLKKTINSIRYIEKENIKDMFMNYDVSLVIKLYKDKALGYISMIDFEHLLSKHGRKVNILKINIIIRFQKILFKKY